MAAKAPFVSEKLAKRKRLLRTLRIIFYSIILVAILVLIWWVSHAKAFQINKVEVSGAAVVSVADIQTDANDILAGTYAFVFPKTQIFLYPKTRIQKLLLSKYPRLESAVISRKGLSLFIALTERVPKYVWCGLTPPSTNEEAFARDCYFTDERGYIFATAPNFSDAVYTKLYASITTPDTPIGSTVFTKESFAHIDTFANGIKNEMIIPYSYVAQSDNDVTILLISHGTTNPKVLYNTTLDPVDTATAFRSAVSTEPLATKLKKSFSTLEYIDVRFAKKVFYKFAEAQKIEQTAILSDGATTAKPQ